MERDSQVLYYEVGQNYESHFDYFFDEFNTKFCTMKHRLFWFADGVDALLMAAGAAGAVANGVAQPLMTLVFSEVIEAFGSASCHDVLHCVSEECLKFFYLAIGSWFTCFLQVACWMITGERQAARIRGLYLEAVLRQEIAFFDKEMTTEQVVERMSGDTILIQDAIGEKVERID